MSRVICIMGESGSGKTTSCRNLDPKATYYIDADRKGLSWANWRNEYNTTNKNYFKSSDAKAIENAMVSVHKNMPQIKHIIVDTMSAIMIDDEMKRFKEKGYDKWQDLAMSVWDLISGSHLLREDLTVIFIGHSQTERDDSGFYFTRLKTSGKKLDKIVLESKFTTVLLSKCVDGQYVFETRSKNSTTKTPMGAFENETIDNDIANVIEALDKFEGGVINVAKAG